MYKCLYSCTVYRFIWKCLSNRDFLLTIPQERCAFCTFSISATLHLCKDLIFLFRGAGYKLVSSTPRRNVDALYDNRTRLLLQRGFTAIAKNCERSLVVVTTVVDSNITQLVCPRVNNSVRSITCVSDEQFASTPCDLEQVESGRCLQNEKQLNLC